MPKVRCALMFTLALALMPRVSYAQRCLGRPTQEEVRFTLGVNYEQHRNTRTSLVPRAGARLGSGFATIGVGRQWIEFGRGGSERAQSVLGISIADRIASAHSWCPLVRAEKFRSYGGNGFQNSGTIQIGIASGRILSAREHRSIVLTTEIGLRQRLGGPGLGLQENVNAFVLGAGLSVVVRRAVAFESTLMIPVTIPGSYEGVLGFGATIGR